MVVTKQIYFWPTFLKSWVHISDDIAVVVGGLQYYEMGYEYREGQGDLCPCLIIIYNVFTLKD